MHPRCVAEQTLGSLVSHARRPKATGPALGHGTDGYPSHVFGCRRSQRMLWKESRFVSSPVSSHAFRAWSPQVCSQVHCVGCRRTMEQPPHLLCSVIHRKRRLPTMDIMQLLLRPRSSMLWEQAHVSCFTLLSCHCWVCFVASQYKFWAREMTARQTR